jgi:hypothetical protein
MRIIVAAAAFAALTATTFAQTTPAEAPKSGPVCIRPFDTPTGSIDHTHVVDAQTVLFYMRDGKIWKNSLVAPCRGILLHGFSFVTHQDEVCSNATSIQVMETGQICQLGAFTPYTPPPDQH